MNLSHPINSLIPSLAGPVLEVLAGTTRPLSGREVARLVPGGASGSGVATVLGDLAAAGIVTQVAAGNALLNTLNRDHLLAPLIVSAAGSYRTFVSRLSELVESVEPRPLRVILFGSVARRDADSDSDIDLVFVFGTDADVEAAGLSVSTFVDEVELLAGNRVDALVYTVSEFGSLKEGSPELAVAIHEDGRELLRVHAS